MEPTVVLFDQGYLSVIAKRLGGGPRLKFDYVALARRLARQRGLRFERLYVYTAPPFQGTTPTADEARRASGYGGFVSGLRAHSEVTVREGRCQKIRDVYVQKGVDTFLTMDLYALAADPARAIRNVILIASDTDFVPVLNFIRQKGVRVLLYYYSDFVRGSPLSMSNHIRSAADETHLLTLADFEQSQFKSNSSGK